MQAVSVNFFQKKSYMQCGASLLEMMVALLVMSLGLLGMAGLQAATAKYRVNVQANMAVAQLVSELTERLRVNPDAAGPSADPSSGFSESKYVLLSPWGEQSKASLAVHTDCDTAACTSDERATYDMLIWRQRVRSALPQGAAIVQGNRKEGVEVALMWMDKEQAADVADADTGELSRSLQKSPVCSADEVSNIVHNCCPAIAAAPEGVRCLRMSFLP